MPHLMAVIVTAECTVSGLKLRKRLLQVPALNGYYILKKYSVIKGSRRMTSVMDGKLLLFNISVSILE